MKQILIRFAPPFYLGAALSAFADISWNQWQFYAICVPFFLLEAIRKTKED